MAVTTAVDPRGRWAKRSYEAIAPVYDEFTAHHRSELWLAELVSQLQRHGLSGQRLLDVGCGTGKSFLPMLERGWKVVGCDISPAMLAIARSKAGDSADLRVADMRALPALGEFDVVWALDDAVNYLLSRGELHRALSCMRGNLAPHGLLLFDLNTLATFRSFFAGTTSVERGGRRLVWRGRSPSDVSPGSVCESRFEVAGDDSPPVGAHSHHQRHFPEAEALEVLRGAGLQCLEVLGHGHDGVLQKPLDETAHTKAIYIARRARATRTL